MGGISTMAATFGIIHRFNGATAEQYERTVAIVHPDGGKGLPPGQISHVAGPSDGAFIVFALWDSEALWVKFRDETLVPGLATVENGPPEPPEETTFAIHSSLSV